MNPFMYGFLDEMMLKKAGWGNVLGDALKKHIKPDAEDVVGNLVERGKAKVRKVLQDPKLVQKGVESATSGGGEIAKSPAYSGGKEYLKKRGKGLLGRIGKRLQKMGE